MEYKDHIKELLLKNPTKLEHTNKNKTALALVDILENELQEFDYYQEKNINYLLTLFDILANTLKNNKTMQNQLHDRFTFIHNLIKNLLHAKPEDLPHNMEKNYEQLKQIINKMENAMLRIYYDNPAEYDPNKMEFIYYIIFHLKYINYFEKSCEKFPHIVNSLDSEGIPLVEKVLEKYLASLQEYVSKPNLGPLDDLIYYDKVMKIIMNSEKIKVDDFTKKIMLQKIKDFANNTPGESNRHKEKLTFFINNIIDTITGEEENMSLEYLNYKYEIHERFKEAHNSEATHILRTNKTIEGIETKRKIYTIDGENAQEIDDGISITYEDGIYHLGIHIANPIAYIGNNSILLDEAIRRTTSIYLSDKCIPLFPISLSGNIMSLEQGKRRYCKSFYFDIDARTGELIKFNIKNEVCSVARNLSYKEFNNLVGHGTDDEDLVQTLVNLINVSYILRRVYNEDIIYSQVNPNHSALTLSETVVESAMIYTNYHVAKYFLEHDLPFIYRSHKIDKKQIDRLSELQERLKQKDNTSQIISNIEMIKNIFPKAYYTSKNCGHYGLGISVYSHTTSPLRRLADNIADMCIDRFILSSYTQEDIKKYTELIDETADAINSKRSTVDDYVIQYEKRKRLIDNRIN